MANHVSALKRARQTVKRTAVNRANKSHVRKSLRALREAITKGDTSGDCRAVWQNRFRARQECAKGCSPSKYRLPLQEPPACASEGSHPKSFVIKSPPPRGSLFLRHRRPSVFRRRGRRHLVDLDRALSAGRPGALHPQRGQNSGRRSGWATRWSSLRAHPLPNRRPAPPARAHLRR